MKKKQSAKTDVVQAKDQPPKATNGEARLLVGLESHEAEMEIIGQLATLGWDGQTAFKEHLEHFDGTAALLAEIGPRDTLESMLAAQMIGIHKAAMVALRRALHPDVDPESRDMNLRNAAKLTSIFARQMDTLDKHRGLSPAPITNNARLESGAQAIVGNIKMHPRVATPPHVSNSGAEPSASGDQVLPTERKRRAAK